MKLDVKIRLQAILPSYFVSAKMTAVRTSEQGAIPGPEILHDNRSL